MHSHPPRTQIRLVVDVHPDGTPYQWTLTSLLYDSQGIPDIRMRSYGAVNLSEDLDGLDAVAMIVSRAASPNA